MNKRTRIWSVLLTLSLLLTMLPTTALAGGFETTTYDELVAKLATNSPVSLDPADDFGWPIEPTTLYINNGIFLMDNWDVPANITLVFAQNDGKTTSGRISCSNQPYTLTLNGNVQKNHASGNESFLGCNVVIAGDVTISGSKYFSILAGEEFTWTVLDSKSLTIQYPNSEGTMIAGNLILSGKLNGSGTVNSRIETNGGGFGGQPQENIEISGNLTLTESLSVGSSKHDVLTIPAGSTLTMTDGTCTVKGGTLNINGTLNSESTRYNCVQIEEDGILNIQNGGSLKTRGNIDLSDGGTLFLDETGVLHAYESIMLSSKPQEGDALVSGNITGAGTIVLHGGYIRYYDEAKGVYFRRDFNDGTIPGVDGTVKIIKADACDHSWSEWNVTQEATCTEAGSQTRTCTSCGAVETVTIPAKGHTEETISGKAATCTETGLTEGSHCSICDIVLVEQTVIPALGHAWSTNNCDEAATCTREGCDATREAGEHVWGDWTVTKEATCTEAGSQTHTCTSCNASESEAITKLGHDYVAVVTAPTCTEQGYTTHTCSRCGDSYVDTYENALGHDWDKGVITTLPTLDAEGVRTFTCQRCGETRTEAVPKLEKQNIWIPGTSIEKTYGDAEFYNTASNLTAGGGALAYSSSNTAVAVVNAQSGKVTIVGAGDAVITVTAAAVANQYAETSATYAVTVAKAPLTITAKDKAITYGEKAANSGYAVSGFVKGEDESVLSSEAVYSYTYKQYGNVGEYAIDLSGLTAKNYDITFVDGKLTVGKATEYTITLSDLEQLAGHVSGVTARIDPYDTSAVLSVEYLVDNSWTATAPQAAGTYQVRAALTASGNIVVPTSAAYTTGTLTVKPGVTVDTGNGPENVDVAVEVSGGTAEITVTGDDLTQIAANADGQVSIDLGSVSDVDTLVLPGNLVEELSKSDKAESLTVSTENASVTLSADVLDTVAKTVTGREDTVSVRLESVSQGDLSQAQQDALNAITTDYPVTVVDVSLVVTHPDGTTDTLHELGGDVTVTVPYEQLPGLLDGQYVVACYISDDGTVTYLFAVADEASRTITFTTNHFSNYAVFVSGKPTSSVTVDGGSGSGIYLAGDTVTVKADSKSGYTFAGWEIVSGDITLANAKAAETTFTMPAANVELKATYTKNSSGGGGGVSNYTLTFETNGGSKIDSATKASGATIDLTGYVPTRNGYDFDGWYSDAKLTDKVTSVKLTKDITVYAKWSEKGGENPFTDVADDAYYADAVIWAVGKGITSGTTATTFSPNAACTRAQAVTFLWRAAGSPEPESSVNPFTDVKADAYYYDAVLWAVEQGITKGTSDTTFSPNATCTRAQIVTFLWRSQKSPASDSVNPFTDVAADAYYASAVLWAAENGITGGTTANTFSPANDCTRAQIVTFLFRCLGGE